MGYRAVRVLLLCAIAGWGLVQLGGCASSRIDDYANTTPRFDFFEYFSGDTTAYGQLQDRSGQVIRRFEVAMRGIRSGNVLRLEEDFIYDDGETQRRVWTFTATEDGRFTGIADDAVGIARGREVGHAVQLNYQLVIPTDEREWTIRFDDWLFRQNDTVVINRARMSKWGFDVGEITLVFSK